MSNKYTFNRIVAEFIKYAKVTIADLAKKELSNKTKKEKLDRALTAYLDTLLVGVKVNLITKWVIDRYVIKNIPVITQAIYDLLKDKVKGL